MLATLLAAATMASAPVPAPVPPEDRILVMEDYSRGMIVYTHPIDVSRLRGRPNSSTGLFVTMHKYVPRTRAEEIYQLGLTVSCGPGGRTSLDSASDRDANGNYVADTPDIDALRAYVTRIGLLDRAHALICTNQAYEPMASNNLGLLLGSWRDYLNSTARY